MIGLSDTIIENWIVKGKRPDIPIDAVLQLFNRYALCIDRIPKTYEIDSGNGLYPNVQRSGREDDVVQ